MKLNEGKGDMPRYEYQTSYFHKRSKARHVRALAILIVVVVAALSLWVGFDWVKERFSDPKTSQVTETTVHSQTVNSFRSEFFEFQAAESWQEIYDERRGNRFVYRNFNGPLVESEFIIEVGSPTVPSLAMMTSTRVLAVTAKEDGRLGTEGLISDHCSKVYPAAPTAMPKAVTMNGTSFLCNPNSTQYHVLVGLVGGDTQLVLMRPNGQTGSYFIEYKSLEVTPNGSELNNILSTFQTR